MRRGGATRWFGRHALALWFGGLALLAALRVTARVARGGPLDASAWAWIAGAALLALIGAAIAWRQARRGT